MSKFRVMIVKKNGQPVGVRAATINGRTLEAFEIDTCVTSFKSKNGAVWHNCRPVRKDEVTFYEDKKDE